MAERLLETAVASRPLAGQEATGDVAVVEIHRDGALVAAVDGLGHGPDAARAAGAAAEVLREHSHEPVVSLVERCHEALRATRGAALSLASFAPAGGTMTWLGVGSVEGRLVSADPAGAAGARSLLLLPGTAGHELPPLVAQSLDVRLGDTLVLATDGVDPGFADALELAGPAQGIAERILSRHGRPADDALVVVARFLGTLR